MGRIGAGAPRRVRGDRLIFGRKRFSDVIRRQLDLFAHDEADGLLADAEEMKRRYDSADRDDAEEAYGDYVDEIDAVKDALADMRDRFAATLDDSEEYEKAFEDAARRRWRWLA
jgi:hypothetical protein